MIYDVNGNSISETVKQQKDYDFWTKAYNMNGGYGYINNYQLDSNGELTSKSGYAVSGFISTQGFKIKVSDISKITVANSKVYYYNASYTKVAKRDLADVLDGDEIDTSVYQSSRYMCLSLQKSSLSFTITAIAPEHPMLVDNKFAHAFWVNVHYPRNDYSYTEMTPYVNASSEAIETSSEYPYFSALVKASSSSTASFPVTVNIRLQVAYYD